MSFHHLAMKDFYFSLSYKRKKMESEDKKRSRDIFSKDISGEENRNGR